MRFLLHPLRIKSMWSSVYFPHSTSQFGQKWQVEPWSLLLTAALENTMEYPLISSSWTGLRSQLYPEAGPCSPRMRLCSPCTQRTIFRVPPFELPLSLLSLSLPHPSLPTLSFISESYILISWNVKGWTFSSTLESYKEYNSDIIVDLITLNHLFSGAHQRAEVARHLMCLEFQAGTILPKETPKYSYP